MRGHCESPYKDSCYKNVTYFHVTMSLSKRVLGPNYVLTCQELAYSRRATTAEIGSIEQIEKSLFAGDSYERPILKSKNI